ncbi:hypothetical protein AIZ11_24770, partial [Salmonella enterica subsp. enterica serovar Typhimurium]
YRAFPDGEHYASMALRQDVVTDTFPWIDINIGDYSLDNRIGLCFVTRDFVDKRRYKMGAVFIFTPYLGIITADLSALFIIVVICSADGN